MNVKTYKMIFIRSGEPDTIGEKTYNGQQNLKLGNTDRAMIETLKNQFDYPYVDMVYTNGFDNAKETAELIYPDNQIIVNSNFMDLDIGEFTGKTYKELENDQDFQNWISNSEENSPPGGENAAAFAQRLVVGINEIFREMSDSNMDTVTVIAGGSVIMAILAQIGIPKKPPYEWAVDVGIGYMLSFSTQMWMRDYSGEVLGYIPMLKEEG